MADNARELDLDDALTALAIDIAERCYGGHSNDIGYDSRTFAAMNDPIYLRCIQSQCSGRASHLPAFRTSV